jgi:glycosyltransferase involved in cell wall biosynthesis
VASLSVVIPATDGRATLGRVVAAVEGADSPPDEVIVVDGPRGLGPAAARNLGARRAKGDVIVFVDADVEVHDDAFRRIRHSFDADAALAALFGSYDDDPDSGRVVSDFRNLLHHHVHQAGAGPATTFWAGLGAVRRDVFLKLGGFDEQRYTRPSVEDIELGMRMHADGGQIVLDPNLLGKHLKDWTLRDIFFTDLLRRGVPWLRLVLERRPGSTALNLGWKNRLSVGAALVLVAAIVHRDARLAIAALAVSLAFDGSFYVLVGRRRGLGAAAVAVPLHIAHRLTSAAAVPIALTHHMLARDRNVGPPPAGRAPRRR